MKKYQIVKNNEDDYTLKYKDKEIHFNSTVDIVSKLQEAPKNAKMKMIFALGKNGMTINELMKETKKDGKTYSDDSNCKELEKIFIQEEENRVLLESTEKMLKTNLEELVIDMELDEKEIEEFLVTLGEVMSGQFPSENISTEIETE